mmetsp:Transcript_11712/g.43440  ORF Transcript_11712/g.43440 Transcript_11712/m.43440 type:complete len:322 (-) Transcript_11712:644-1609(-)
MSRTLAMTPHSCCVCLGLITCVAQKFKTGSSEFASRPVSAVFKPPLRPISSKTAATTSARPPRNAESSASAYRNRRNAWSCCARRTRLRCSIFASPAAAVAFWPRMKYWYDPASRRRGPVFFCPPPPLFFRPRPSPPAVPSPSPSLSCLGFDLRRMLNSRFAVPTAITFAHGESATDNTGPGYFAPCVTEKESSSKTLTCPSREPVSNRGEVLFMALRFLPTNPLNKSPSPARSSSATGTGPPSGATWQHITVFWWQRIFETSFPPLNASHTHTSCPPTLTSIWPPGSQTTSSTGAPCFSVIPQPPFPPLTRESHSFTVPS